jgi:preprotein translocase subunit SecG
MEIFIYILTFFLVLDCLFLGLLILMQLPKKEAGLGGAAFGGGAVDALVGAGAGNVLTKATKWAAITFFGLVIALSLLYTKSANRDSNIVKEKLEATSTQTAPVALPQDLKEIVVEEPAAATTPAPESTNAATQTVPDAPQQ